MQGVVGKLALVNPPPQVFVGPVGERVELPDAARLVMFDQLRRGPRRALLAADPGDPPVGVREGALERCDLGGRAAVLRAGPWRIRAGCVLDLDLDPEPLLELPPRLHRLVE